MSLAELKAQKADYMEQASKLLDNEAATDEDIAKAKEHMSQSKELDAQINRVEDRMSLAAEAKTSLEAMSKDPGPRTVAGGVTVGAPDDTIIKTHDNIKDDPKFGFKGPRQFCMAE